eukprot:scaffold9783_cov127-Isochrysis_galbana.AAC.13
MEGERRSRYGGATLQSGGIVCLIVVNSVSRPCGARGYERPTDRRAVEKPSQSQIAADVGGAHTMTVAEVAELPSLRAACRIEALPQSPDLRHPLPAPTRCVGEWTRSSRTDRPCRRVPLPCREARLRRGRGEVRVSRRRSGRGRQAPGLLCRRSVDRSFALYMWLLFFCAPAR